MIEIDHLGIMSKSIAILRNRGEQYGDVGDVFDRACSIFEMITGQPMSRSNGAIFMHSMKLARIRTTPEKMDNYVDGINYIAFAAQFANDMTSENMIDDGIREMAEKLAPQREE